MMIRRHVKFLVLSAVLLALPVVASAQMSRVEGMALQGDYIKDWSGMFTYGSQVANVGNLVYGELGNVSSPPFTFDRSVGAVVGNLWEGRLGTWALHLHEQQTNLGQGDAFSNPGAGNLSGDPNVNTAESFDLMWGKKFGTTRLGLTLARTQGAAEFEAGGVVSKFESDLSQGDPNLARNMMGFAGGVGFEMNPTTNLEVGIQYQNRTWLEDVPGQKSEQNGSSAYLLAARAMWQWQPNIMVVPVFKYYNFDLGQQVTPTAGLTTKTDNSRKGWQIGGAGNWTLGSNDLFVLGLTFAQNKLDQQEDIFGLGVGDTVKITETIMPQLFAALETHINSWLTLRFGANKGAFQKLKVEELHGLTSTFTGSTFNMSLGAGLKFGNLQLDAILDNNFPNHLPYFISGDVTSNTFTKVTATYPW